VLVLASIVFDKQLLGTRGVDAAAVEAIKTDEWAEKVIFDSPEFRVGENWKSPGAWQKADQWVPLFFTHKLSGSNSTRIAAAVACFDGEGSTTTTIPAAQIQKYLNLLLKGDELIGLGGGATKKSGAPLRRIYVMARVARLIKTNGGALRTALLAAAEAATIVTPVRPPLGDATNRPSSFLTEVARSQVAKKEAARNKEEAARYKEKAARYKEEAARLEEVAARNKEAAARNEEEAVRNEEEAAQVVSLAKEEAAQVVSLAKEEAAQMTSLAKEEAARVLSLANEEGVRLQQDGLRSRLEGDRFEERSRGFLEEAERNTKEAALREDRNREEQRRALNRLQLAKETLGVKIGQAREKALEMVKGEFAEMTARAKHAEARTAKAERSAAQFTESSPEKLRHHERERAILNNNIHELKVTLGKSECELERVQGECERLSLDAGAGVGVGEGAFVGEWRVECVHYDGECECVVAIVYPASAATPTSKNRESIGADELLAAAWVRWSSS
jgi:hypothetical protein